MAPLRGPSTKDAEDVGEVAISIPQLGVVDFADQRWQGTRKGQMMGRPAITTTDEVLECVRRCMTKKPYPPTVEELRDAMGVGSTRTTRRYLKALEAEGRIERWPGARGMRVVDATKGP